MTEIGKTAMAWELIVLLIGLTAVTLGCLLPSGWLPILPHDKLLHFLAFACLSFLAGRLARNGLQMGCWLAGLLFAGWLIEILQNFVPGRKFCWRDMIANAAGIVLAACCWPLLSIH